LSGLAAAGYGEWQEIKPVQGGWSVRKFQLYQPRHRHSLGSAIGNSRSSVDVDEPKSAKNAGSADPEAVAKTVIGDELGVMKI
jgi:hypothetical protein